MGNGLEIDIFSMSSAIFTELRLHLKLTSVTEKVDIEIKIFSFNVLALKYILCQKCSKCKEHVCDD